VPIPPNLWYLIGGIFAAAEIRGSAAKLKALIGHTSGGSQQCRSISHCPRRHGQGGICPLPPWKCCKVFCALVVAIKRPIDSLFMHYFHIFSSAWGSTSLSRGGLSSPNPQFAHPGKNPAGDRRLCLSPYHLIRDNIRGCLTFRRWRIINCQMLFRRIKDHSSSRHCSSLAPMTPRMTLPGVALQEITVVKQ